MTERICIYSLFCLLLCFPATAQSERPPETQPNAATQNRPTLGPATPPSLYGPQPSPTTDLRKLARLNKIYVESIDNKLSDKLIEGLAKSGRVKVVTNVKEADGILRGTCFDSRHLKTVHSEVFITDRITGASIWQDIVRRPFNPPALGKAVDNSAAVILEHLKESIQEAQRK